MSLTEQVTKILERDLLEAAQTPPSGERPLSPKEAAIIQILRDKPILVTPCLMWLQKTRAQLSTAELGVLFTPEQIEAMRQELAKVDKK